MSTLEADTAARALASREFARAIVVVAGAGTGKTTTLVGRVVTWLVGPGWSEFAAGGAADVTIAERAVDAILAITFTKAAAAEMDARVRAALRELEQGRMAVGVVLPDDAPAPDATMRARARRLRLSMDRALATTIHGFCQGLLAEHPAEASLAPGFAVDADAELVPEFARTAVEEDLAEAFRGRPDEDWLRLARDGVGPDAVARCVVGLRGEGVRGADLARDPASDAALAALLAELEPRAREFAAVALDALRKVTGASVVERAVEGLASLLALFDTPAAAEPLACARGLAALELEALGEKLDEWSAGKFGAKGEKALGDAAGAAQAAAVRLRSALRPLLGFDVDAFRARRVVVRRVLARAEALGEDALVLTFGDLLSRAARLVEDDAALRTRLRRRYRQILVDEFQDTDSVQCRLVRALALGGAGARPGLFLVGDPKQSIYGWRGADLRAYDEFVAEVLADGGVRVELVKNFRSTPEVLAAVTRFVSPTMREEYGVQPPFQPLHAHRTEPGPKPELWITWDVAPDSPKSFEKTSVDDAARYEAARLARALRAEHDAGTHWKDMAVLLRARTRLDVLLEALRAADVPFQVEGDRSYYQRREILDATALLGAIVDPGDTLSLLAFLRSATGGLPDAALEHLWDAGLPEEVQQLGGDPSVAAAAIARVVAAAHARAGELARTGWPGGRGLAGFPASLGHALESLALLRRSLREDPADRFVERLRELVLVETLESARYHGRYRAANLERFFRRLEQALESSGDPVSVLRTLRRALEEERQAKEARPRGEVEDAVRFLTIHAAKGLEFECVFLPGMAAGGKRGRSADGFDRSSGEQKLCGAASPGWARVEEAAAAREGAERVRLLYVALTRAKRRLVLSGVWREQAKGLDATQASSFRDLAEHGLPAEFGPLARRHATAGTLEFECDGLSVRLAATEDAGTPRRPDVRADPRAADSAREDHERLASLSSAARERAARPRIAPPSARHVAAPGAETARDARPAESPLPGPTPAPAAARDEARLAGILVHAALEAAPDFEAARARLDEAARAASAPSRVLADARAVLDAVERGPLGDRLRALAASIVARELPLVVATGGSAGPTEAWTGSADLVLRDADAWVVVDYKTEGLAGRDARAAAREHAPQLDVYASALAGALALEAPPRREVWFLRDGVVVALD